MKAKNINHSNTAIIWGSTGLIGSELKNLLIQDSRYKSILCPVRTKSSSTSPTLKEILFDFDSLERDFTHESLDLKEFQADHIFITLGTTIKKAGSKENFRKVDFDYCLLAGKIAEKTNAKVFSVVTAIGADESSSVFYNQVKGELERSVGQLDIPNIQIFRPSLLLGERKEFRFGEKLAEIATLPLSFLLQGSLQKYKPIQGKDVAKGMVFRANEPMDSSASVQIFEGSSIKKYS